MKKQDVLRIERLRLVRLGKYQRRSRRKSRHPGSRHQYEEHPDIYKFKNLAPNNFSFINNPEEMLDYYDRARKKAEKSIAVKFDLSLVEELTPDAIALHASVLNDKNYCPGNYLSGNAPKKSELRHKFMSSGFYEHVKSKANAKTRENNFLLHKVSEHKVEPVVAKEATDFAAKKTFGKDIILRPVYEILIELMANTNNHASVIDSVVYDWWLYVFYDKKTNVTSYSFLDFGVGIFRSKAFTRYKNFLFVEFGRDKKPEEMAEDLLNGKISSRTGLGERGRGFSCITQNTEYEMIKKFIIISNNVFIDVKNRQYRALENSFSGTFVYWEVGDEN